MYLVVLETKNLCKDYNIEKQNINVLSSINLSFSDNEFCGIVGPSGSGKTTLLYTLSGLEKPTSGDVIQFQKNTKDMKPIESQKIRKTELSFIFQFYNLLPNLTVFENIQIAQLLGNIDPKEDIISLLESVGMAKYKDYYPNQLSGGMQQRVAIARSLVNRPKIIFADEPTGNLDVASGLEVMNLLKKMQEERKITVIMVTHNPDNLSFCNRQIKLLDGEVLLDEFK